MPPTAGPGGQDFALAYNADGTLDTSFDADGKLTTDFFRNPDVAVDIAIQSDGKIVAAGYASNSGSGFDNFALARYNADGTLDTSFGADGKLTTDFFGSGNAASSIAIQSDGKIVAAGYASNSSGRPDFALARYRSAPSTA